MPAALVSTGQFLVAAILMIIDKNPIAKTLLIPELSPYTRESLRALNSTDVRRYFAARRADKTRCVI